MSELLICLSREKGIGEIERLTEWRRSVEQFICPLWCSKDVWNPGRLHNLHGPVQNENVGLLLKKKKIMNFKTASAKCQTKHGARLSMWPCASTQAVDYEADPALISHGQQEGRLARMPPKRVVCLWGILSVAELRGFEWSEARVSSSTSKNYARRGPSKL